MNPQSSGSCRRLSSVCLEDFRLFKGSHEVPLDADVVLIWGRNGTGKTTLFQSIEYALTGTIADLAHFSGDYPRCLVNASSSGPARVRLSYRDSAGDENQLVVTTSGSEESQGLPEPDSRYFRERCYLSQSRLGRLLEAYATEDQSGQIPLVRFVEDVLDLQELGALVDGLHVAGDVRRLRAEASQYMLLETQVGELAESLRLTKERAGEARTQLAEVVTKIQELLGSRQTLDLLLPEGDDPAATVDALSAVDLPDRIAELADQLAQLEEDVASVRIVEQNLASGLEVEKSLAAAAAECEAADESREVAVSALTSVAKAAEAALRAGGLDASGLDPVESPGAVVEVARSRLSDSVQLMDSQRAEIDRLAASLGALQDRRQALVSSLEALSGSEGSDEDEDRLMDVIQKAIHVVAGETCPVCDRDFTETNQGGLRDHLTDKLDALLAARELLREQRQQWVAEQAQLSRIDAETKSVSSRLNALKEQSEELDEKYEARKTGLAQLDASEAELKDATAEMVVVLEARNRLENLRETARQLDDSKARLQALAGDRSIELADRRPHAAARYVLAQLLDRLGGARSDLELLRQLSGLLEDGLAEGREIERTSEKLSDLESRQQQSSAALARAQNLQSKAKGLADEAVRVRADLLESVFNDTLNSMWDDLFARLAPREAFHPAFSPPGIVRKKLRLGMETKTEVGSFCGPGSVLSAGNLNTAALSMFLALNLVQQPRMSLLMLDDPVQSMDDVHLMNLAAMLRSLQRDAGRQLIIAVHEKALYEYLSLELGPQGRNQSLLTIELREDPARRVEVKRHQWEGDPVLFASAGSADARAS